MTFVTIICSNRGVMPKFVVRYGVMRALGIMSARENALFSRGTQVIARTERGLETGIVLCEATTEAVAQIANPSQGQIQREMSAGDSLELSKLLAKQRDEFAVAQRLIAESGLDMKLVDVEHVFGGERVVIYYLSENRIDFRDLVKGLAGEFQTRIEMRQIGSRDEAKLLADYGDCGKPVCCNTHLSEMPPVSMKMAKLQKATLDPTKISGRCGRLKCCLRYEYETYEVLQKELPSVGSEIITNNGRGRVLAQEILAQQLLIETEDHRRVLIPAAEVLTVLKRQAGGPPPESDSGSSGEGGQRQGMPRQSRSNDPAPGQEMPRQEASRPTPPQPEPQLQQPPQDSVRPEPIDPEPLISPALPPPAPLTEDDGFGVGL